MMIVHFIFEFINDYLQLIIYMKLSKSILNKLQQNKKESFLSDQSSLHTDDSD